MNVKFKCPFCGQDYDLTGEQVLQFLHDKLQCAAPGCEKKFYLAEVIPCLGDTRDGDVDSSGLVALIESEQEIEQEIAKCKKELAEKQEKAKAGPTKQEIIKEIAGSWGKNYDETEFDKIDKAEVREAIASLKEMMADSIKDLKDYLANDLKDELKEAREEYNQSKKDLPGKKQARHDLYYWIGKAFCEGKIKVPPSPEDIEKLVRIYMYGNQFDDDLPMTLESYGMEYCLGPSNNE